jgi:RNA polymerase sigma-70 factor (ECF subfamily)
MSLKKYIKPIGKRYFVCVWVCNDYDLAQDLAQETFIVWQKLETFRNE